MSRSMRRDLRRSIQKSLGRYLAILAIIALGAGFLVGLRSTKGDMMATAQDYIDTQALFDLRVLNTYGYTREAVETLAQQPGIGAAEGAVSLDVLLRSEDSEDDLALRLLSLPAQISVPKLQAGRWPQRAGECLADGFYYTDADIGKTLTLSQANEENTRDSLTVEEFTIVGLCSSPIFMNFERGSTTLGKGSLAAYLYVTDSTFDLDGVYTEIALKLDENYPLYDAQYDQLLTDMADTLEPLAEELAQSRYETVQAEARQELEDGQAAYDEGLQEYETQRKQALEELQSAEAQLDEGEAELQSKQQEWNEGQAQLEAAQAQIDAGLEQLRAGEIQLQEQKAQAYAQFAGTQEQLSEQQTQASQGLAQIEDGLSQLEDGLQQIYDGLSQIEDGLQQLALGLDLAETGLTAAQQMMEVVEKGLEEEPDHAGLLASKEELEQRIQELEGQKAELEAQQTEALEQQASLQAQKADLESRKEELETQRDQVQDGLAQIQDGLRQLESARNQASDEFAGAQATIEANRLELDQAQAELDENRQVLEAGAQQLEEGRQELAEGRETYEANRASAEKQLADAEKQLDEAEQELEEGRQALADMTEPDVYVLDRNTNVAYACFESDAEIVEGVSRVFPLFFFLVAALVCITTMSKMVDEERTQIGVMKALGYSGRAITAKYLAYSGSASLFGCILGVLVGSVIFPRVIWQGYAIMYNFASQIRLVFDWSLCAVIVGSYTVCMLAVTWFCCRRELVEVPAELIRPKSPKAGKRLLLERLPFWKHLSFLRKVSIRNIFRYRKRLVMMLLGVGGCAALVVTGFGIKDSIVGIADYQFEQVTLYDLAVTFSQDQGAGAQEDFRDACAGVAEDMMFLYESTADLTVGGKTKSVYFLASEADMSGFVDLHRGKEPVAFPGTNQAVLNNGLAEALNLEVGDTVTLRTADLDTLSLTVSGIFDNNVYNYVLVSSDTLRTQWAREPETNTAYLNVLQELDVREAAAAVSDRQDVISVTVCQDMADRVTSMMDSLDYIVALVVISAAALAFIVMYNLTNINITERVREIATIEVLGFYPMESAAYVFREGMALTAMGCALGLAAGKFLHAFVISQIRVDMVYFSPVISWTSYLWAVGFTFLFACMVDFFLYFKLNRINMAEALKSVE